MPWFKENFPVALKGNVRCWFFVVPDIPAFMGIFFLFRLFRSIVFIAPKLTRKRPQKNKNGDNKPFLLQTSSESR